DGLHELRAVGEAGNEHLAGEVDAAADEALQRGEAAVQAALEVRDRAVAVRDDPRRGALEDRELLDLGLDPGDDLDRGRAGADDGDLAALEVVVGVPAGGVEGG